ncbi:piggyBac transposable element-derived protein 4-like [Anabrus simplex]|uniref:piggyBac transposable element-derived protein 4-like n=1 Tax=Anabrus simplex TaxID=316456 RepID=UPI0035A2DC62
MKLEYYVFLEESAVSDGFSDESDIELPSSDVSISSSEELDDIIRENEDGDAGERVHNLEDWKWTQTDNVPNNMRCIIDGELNSVVARRLGENPGKAEVLGEFQTDEFWELVKNETNANAVKCLRNIESNPTKKKTYDEENWFPVTKDELKAHFALCILMSQTKKSSVQEYWTKRRVRETPIFSETMSHRCFSIISRYLHFAPDSPETQCDKLWKVRPVLQLLLDKFQKLYVPGKRISIDESLMKFRGRLAFVQFNPSKRARFGIKFYKVCCSDTSYCWKFRIYVGKEPQHVDGTGDARRLLCSEAIVLELCDELLGSCRTIYMDNWYSSPTLFRELIMKNTNAIGTVHPNRKLMPPHFAATNLKKGELTFASANGILATKWVDKKNVHLLSTVHQRPDFAETKSKRGKLVLKPNMVVDYNSGMGGVDSHDQRLASYPLMRRYAKGYKKIYFYVFDMAMQNASVVHHMLNPGKRRPSFSSFRVDVAEQILEGVVLPDYRTRGRPSAGSTPTRLQERHWGHFPTKIPPTTKKVIPSRRCKVCVTRGLRKESSFECHRCKVAMHEYDSFMTYHIQKDFTKYI